MSPTQRTLKRCKDNGWIAAVSEHWQAIPNHPGGGVRKDLFGFIDVVVLAGGKILAVQATSGATGASRVKKIRDECNNQAVAWLECGGVIEVWAWRKLKRRPDGRLWHPKITSVTIQDLLASKQQGSD